MVGKCSNERDALRGYRFVANATTRTEAGNLAVVNGIKNSTNKIVIPCKTWEDGEEIIEQLKNSKAGDLIFI